MDPLHLLAWSVVVGSTAPGVAIVLRALPAIERLVLAGTRPWACDVCLAWWTTAATTLVAVFASHDLEVLCAAGPAYPLAYKLLGWLSQPMSVPPPGFPELADPPAAATEPVAPPSDDEADDEESLAAALGVLGALSTEEPAEPVEAPPAAPALDPPVELKRKRGRPRKHPLPPEDK